MVPVSYRRHLLSIMDICGMPVRNSIKRIRIARGLSVVELAERGGISRQTVYAIEDGTFVPNTAIALQLARTLDSAVEELFSLDYDTSAELEGAEPLSGSTAENEESRFVRLCRVNQRLIAVPVSPQPAYLPLADGVVAGR